MSDLPVCMALRSANDKLRHEAAGIIDDMFEALASLVEANIKRGPFDEPLGTSEQVAEINAACAALRKARGES